jgi:hypothetical protein
MAERASFRGAAVEAQPDSVIQRLRHWWRSESAEERYLAAASDVSDLERRMRALERGREGRPLFVTFNH